jgi:NADH dehydrogenase
MAKVIIIGGGFGGLTAAQALANVPVAITVVDRTNHHLFQPLLYQVAMAGLSPAEIAMPIRSILAPQKNASVLLAEATAIDTDKSKVTLKDGELGYDYLIVASGAETSYFGHADWEGVAPGLKSLDDAVEIRERVLLAFETAERSDDPKVRERLLTFAVIGGGPTGVELAGALAELANRVLSSDFRRIDPSSSRIVLIEAGDRILPGFAPSLSAKAAAQLRELGVEVKTMTRVTAIDEFSVTVDGTALPCSVVIWGAGVRATTLTKSLGTALDSAGRVVVEQDCSVAGKGNVFVIGDAAAFTQDGKVLPGVSPVAMQQARSVAANIQRDLRGKPRENFAYVDKGSMATIGRSRAIAQTGRLHMSGFVAWIAWLFIHIWYLIGFRNRFAVLFNWLYQYVSYRRGARLITGHHFRERSRARPPETVREVAKNAANGDT